MSPHDCTNASGPYRSRKGMLLGVCQGLADHFGISPFWVRMAAVAALPFTFFWPVIVIYIVAALIMKLEPILPLEDEDDAEFYHSYAHSSSMALHRLKRTFDNLDRRIQRMEDIVTSKENDWDRRFQEDREG